MAPLMLLLGLLACGETRAPPDDRAIHLSVLTDADGGAGERLLRCGGIADAELRGDCSLAAVEPALRAGEDAAAWCPKLSEALWQQECWFVGAEAAYHAGEVDEAAARCGSAGSFGGACAQHLFQRPVRELIGAGGPDVVAETLPAAREALARWQVVLGELDIRERYWAHYFRTAAERGAVTDCAALADELRAACQNASSR